MINSWEQLMKDLASVGKCFLRRFASTL